MLATQGVGMPRARDALRFAGALFRDVPRKTDLLRAAVTPYRRQGIQRLTSADGTRLTVRRTGNGPPVVFVHGGLGDKDNFVVIEVALRDEFTVWVYDRRGRAGSGDADDYSLDREVDDLQAVVTAAGGPPHVIAHSFGAGVAMLAARRGVPMRSLVLYEPPLHWDVLVDEDRQKKRIEDAVDRGDLDTALLIFDRHLAHIPEDEIAAMRALPPVWQGRRNAVRALPRELRAVSDWTGDPERWALPADLPVLSVHGGDTDNPVFPTIDEFRMISPHAEAVVLPGQRHLALGFAPTRFTEVVADFMRRH
jgi:pimeloyl-ACP methyl ester carboxylesterase